MPILSHLTKEKHLHLFIFSSKMEMYVADSAQVRAAVSWFFQDRLDDVFVKREIL